MSENITINLKELITALTKALNKDMGSVRLIPGLKIGKEVDPITLPTSSSVMGSDLFVPHKNYQLTYDSYRYMRFIYLIERAGKYETGDLEIISTAIETKNKPELARFTPPVLYTKKITRSLSHNTPIGVELGAGFNTSYSNEKNEPYFGITYRSTMSSASFPVLRMSLASVIILPEPDAV